jgi:signal transduction histidine kinase/DNA-binding response OmpR family regulator
MRKWTKIHKLAAAVRANDIRVAIYAKVITVIIAIAVVIIIFGNMVGAMFLTRSISISMENDMLIAVDIADQYLTGEIELLKTNAVDAARDIALLYSAGEREGILERVCAKYPRYVGMAVFDKITLQDSWGRHSVSPELIHEPFMRLAQTKGSAVSNTMHTLDGSLVMYVSASINDDLALAAVLPGRHFADLLSQFRLWQTGHVFINDEDGYVISNPRPHWVQERYNFLDMAKADSVYENLAAMARRAIAGERGIGRYSINGVPRMAAFRPVSSPDVGWFVAIVAPLSESALKDIPGGVLLNAIVTLVLSIVAAILGAALLRRPYEEVDHLRRVAEIASISKSTFLANMSHEIRTPMNSIVGFSELALDGKVSPKTRDYLGKIRTNAEWLLQIINDILDISKIESGKMELENIPFDIHDLFASCRTLVMPKAAEKGILLHFYAEPSTGKRPLGDPTRLRQVFVNLLSNAIKFTNTGVVKLLSDITETRERSITIHFEIRDSGIGMTPEQIDKIFEPFVQAETGTTRKYGGTGLGLAITKNIVEMMGGKLLVESTPGVGSKFSFDLTFDTIDITDDDMFEKKIVFDQTEKPMFEGEVLLCEDNVMNQEVICEHLARVGLKTVVADNGKIGVEMVQSRMEKGEKQFDLIFMDMHMPVMDGLEASSKILELKAGVPMVAMTANIMSNDMEVYRRSGMNDCVGKPFTSQELWRCLVKYFTPVSWQTVDEVHHTQAEDILRQKLMDNFVKDNRTRFSEITEAIGAGDIKLAHRMTHTLKSNAGQLGKILLQQAAENVERQLQDGENLTTPQQMNALDMELKAAFTELTAELAAKTGKDFAPTSDKTSHERPHAQSARELIEKLEPMLEMGSPECQTFIDNLRLMPGSEELIRQIDDFDFEAALASLAELKKKWEKELI